MIQKPPFHCLCREPTPAVHLFFLVDKTRKLFKEMRRDERCIKGKGARRHVRKKRRVWVGENGAGRLSCEGSSRMSMHYVQSTRFLGAVSTDVFGTGSTDIQLQQVLQAVGAAAAAFGDVADDVDNGGEDIAVTVGQQSGGLDMVHLGDLLVQLDEAGAGLATGNGDETFFDDGTVIRLYRQSQIGRESKAV
jgi:hypothetical protein